jgi:hypothetical protein
VLHDGVVVVEIFEKAAILLLVIFVGAAGLRPLLTANQQHRCAVIFHGIERSPCNDVIQLGSTNRSLLRPDRELLGSTVLPSTAKGRIADHHILTAGDRTEIRGIVLGDGKTLSPQIVGPLIIQFIHRGHLGVRPHEQGSVPCGRLVNSFVVINPRQLRGQVPNRDRGAVLLPLDGGGGAGTQSRLTLIEISELIKGLQG